MSADQPTTAARKPSGLWRIETGRTLYGLAWGQAVNGSVVHHTSYALTRRRAGLRAHLWLVKVTA